MDKINPLKYMGITVSLHCLQVFGTFNDIAVKGPGLFQPSRQALLPDAVQHGGLVHHGVVGQGNPGDLQRFHVLPVRRYP